MRTIREDAIVIGYSRYHRKFVLVKKSQHKGIEPEVFRFDPDKMSFNNEFFGECTNFQVDNTSRFIIATFAHTNKLCVLDIN